MDLKRALMGVCVAASAVAMPAMARVDVAVTIGVPPPVAVVEAVPVQRPGHIWAPGYWGWHGDRHIWIRGRWVVERSGHDWVGDRWVQDGPRWRLEPGRWAPREQGRGHGKGKGYAKGHYKKYRD